ncbi:unnamed protein product [Rhodiola kirilowii]
MFLGKQFDITFPADRLSLWTDRLEIILMQAVWGPYLAGRLTSPPDWLDFARMLLTLHPPSSRPFGTGEIPSQSTGVLSLSWLSLWRMVDSDLGLGIGGGVGELVAWVVVGWVGGADSLMRVVCFTVPPALGFFEFIVRCSLLKGLVWRLSAESEGENKFVWIVSLLDLGVGAVRGWADEAWMAYWSVRDKESQVTGAEMSAVGVGALLPVSVAPSTANLSANKSQAGGNELNVDFREDEGRAVTSHKWRMVISYDGTRYSGWQYQLHPPTIQCVVEKALTKVTKLDRKELCLVGASRTDKGVHAWGQVAHFLTPFNYAALDDVHAALNGVLPDDIRVRELSPALPEFHARFSVESKIYHYKIYNDAVMDPFQRNYAFHSTYRLNPAAMKVAATHFVGTHDFSAFANVSRNDRVTNPVKRIYRYEVVEMGGALLQLEVEGSGFLYKQVRNMAALLYQIGKESIPPEIVPMILASRNRRELAKYTLDAPPHGLTLISVKYNKEHLQLPVDCSPVSFGRCRTSSYCKLPFY